MLEGLTKRFPYSFLIIITLLMAFIYFSFIKLLVLDIHPWRETATVIFLVVYHIIFLLLVWSMVEAILKDPGKVPSQWGFGGSSAKKYCLICHVFKPQRTHHCSTCSRCVLNMDHHCPWINTCVGFHNRKPFILMLFYTTLTCFINIVTYAASLPGILEQFQIADAGNIIKIIVVTIALILNSIIFVVILIFLKFHIELILANSTTIQSLELKRQGKNPEQIVSEYSIGTYYNWVQVFGLKSWTWFIPIFLTNGGPTGDGVMWPKGQKK